MDVLNKKVQLRQSPNSLLDLPVEILDKIMGFLTIPLAERRFHSVRVVAKEESRVHPPFKHDCKAIRLTCKLFSNLKRPSAALFHDFFLYVSDRSLQNLSQLSQHLVLRHYVRRVIFIHPFFRKLRFKDYSTAMSEQVESDFRRKLENTGLSAKQQSCAVKSLMLDCFPYKDESVRAGFKAYQKSFQDQKRLLHKGHFIEGGGCCLSKLPELRSAVLAGKDVGSFETEIDVSSSWLKKRHPDVLFHRSERPFWPLRDFEEYNDADYLDAFTLQVFRCLAVSQVELHDTVFWHHALTSSFNWTSLPGFPISLKVSAMRRLDLRLSDFEEDHDWSLTLVQILDSMIALEDLYLRFALECSRDTEYIKLFNLKLPQLSRFLLSNCVVDARDLGNFVRNHPLLHELTTDAIIEDHDLWPPFFHAVHDHTGLKDIELNCLWWDYEREPIVVSTRRMSQAGDQKLEEDRALYDYLLMGGTWTDQLESRW